ncbi:MAG TPA: hypothetical protein DCS66_10230, partial [Flavobacteriaceae bacterium]|nr:hypothetical protein [Flavobacteriaceae bacterium]
FSNGVEGQMIIFRATNDEVTIQNNINIQLSGSANFAMNTDDTLTLVRFDGKWYETSRMEV